MLYCFVKEDIQQLAADDPLQLQVEYATHLDRVCFCCLADGKTTDMHDNETSLCGESVFLRAAYDNMSAAIRLLESKGAQLVETTEDILRTEQWVDMNITKRKILKTTVEKLCNPELSPEVAEFLETTPSVFIKSLHKGFTCKISAEKIKNKDQDFLRFIQGYGNDCPLMLSALLALRRDSLGNKEARFFVLDNMIINCSRNLHSLKHAVPKTLRDAASEIVCRITEKGCFAKNYVLDMGEFENTDVTFVDVVEINPLTASMCYVNNSIFTDEDPFITRQKTKLMMGAEYCYHRISNPHLYHISRMLGINYEYSNTEHYSFIQE